MKENRRIFADVAIVGGPVLLDEAFGMLIGSFLIALINRLGSDCLAEYTVAGLVQLTMIGVVGSIGTGAAVMVARAMGAGDWHKARAVAGNVLSVSFMLGIGLAIAGWQLGDRILLTFSNGGRPSDTIRQLSHLFWLALPFLLTMQVGKSVMQGMGATGDAFRLNAFYSTTGLGLGSAFVSFRPELGILAVAWGISLSAMAGLIYCLVLLGRHSGMRFSWRHLLAGDFRLVHSLCRLSAPVVIEQSFMQVGFSIFILILVGIGAEQFAAHQIAQQLEGASLAVGSCLAVATLALVGKALGQNAPERAKRYTSIILRLTLVSMTICGLALFSFAEAFAGLFTKDTAIKGWAVGCVSLALLEQPTLAVTFIIGNTLRAAGDTKWPMLSTIAGMWLVRLPLCLLLIGKFGYGITFAWVITATDYLVRSIILVLRYRTLQRAG